MICMQSKSCAGPGLASFLHEGGSRRGNVGHMGQAGNQSVSRNAARVNAGRCKCNASFARRYYYSTVGSKQGKVVSTQGTFGTVGRHPISVAVAVATTFRMLQIVDSF